MADEETGGRGGSGHLDQIGLLGQNALAMLTFWNDHGGLSGRWDPRDRATINAMKYVCSRYGS